MAEILAMSRSSLRRLLFRPRFWVSLLLALGCVLIVFFKVPPYLSERGYQLQAAEPFLILLPSFFPQILLLISFLLLVGDVPFLYPGMEITVIRSSRQRWLAAQILAAMAAAVLWLLFLLTCTVLVFLGHISFPNEWSIFLKALARSRQPRISSREPVPTPVLAGCSCFSSFCSGVWHCGRWPSISGPAGAMAA